MISKNDILNLILTDIQSISKKLNKNTIKLSEYKEYGEYSPYDVISKFDTWNKALKKAGLQTYNELRFVSKEKILADIQSIVNELNQNTLTSTEYVKYGKYNINSVLNRFGNWEKVRKNAKLKKPRRKTKKVKKSKKAKKTRISAPRIRVTAHEILSDIQYVSEIINSRMVSSSKYKEHGKYSQSLVIKHFKRWNLALEAANLQTAQKSYNAVSAEEILADIKSVAEKLNKNSLSIMEYTKHGTYTHWNVRTRFKKWNDAIEKANLQININEESYKVTAQELIADLQSVARKLNKNTLVQSEYNEYGKHSINTICGRLNGWYNALTAANLESVQQTVSDKISDNDILTDIQSVSKKLNKNILSRKEYKKHGQYSVYLVRKRFKQWSDALKKANLQPAGIPSDISEQEILADIKSVAEKLNKNTLSIREYRKHGKYTEWSVQKRFKQWSEAVKKANLQKSVSKIEEQDIIDDLQAVAKKLNKNTVTYDEYGKYGKYNSDTLSRRFGSWRNVLEVANLHVSKRSSSYKIKTDDLLADIKSVADTLMKNTLSKTEYKNLGKFNIITVAQRFGSWENALKETGLE
ncbi:MAG: hypothetical protein FWE27_09280 [Defluviitaleaceae bacterium]|nr:hypothetical protein [Defluviitaleaceae bacterium]